MNCVHCLFAVLQDQTSVRFSSKIKMKNQERFSLLYTELDRTPKLQQAANENEECSSGSWFSARIACSRLTR